MKAIRTGLVGCGRISQFHLKAIQENREYQCISVCDSVLERAHSMASSIGVKSYQSLELMLQTEKLDLISLATPSGMHPAQARLCADYGVACLSEKPFGVYYQESKQVVEHFKSKGVPLFVSFQNRYNPTIRKVREWFDAGLFGKIYLLQANVFWQRPQSYYEAENWRGKRSLDGGAFMNQASHYVDLLSWFGGEVTRVQSELATFSRHIECEDTGAALIRFKNESIGVISVTTLAYPENLEGSLTILGERASIKIGGKALNEIEICKGAHPDFSIASQNLSYQPKTIYGNGHSEYYRNLVQYMREPNHPDAVTGEEGLKSLYILSKLYSEWDAKHR